MIRANRLFINWLLMLALPAQALPVAAQNKQIKKNAGEIKPGPVAEAFVNVAPPSVSRGQVTVNWKAGAPQGVTIKGFDVALDVSFSNGQSQRLNRSVGGAERSATFNIKLPEAPKGGGVPPKDFDVNKPEPPKGSNSGGDAAELDARRCELECLNKAKDSKSVAQCQEDCRKKAAAKVASGKGDFNKSDATPRRFGEGSISGGKNSNTANNAGKGVGSNAGSGGVKDNGFNRVPPADPVTIKNLTARVTGKFSAGADASALREFAPPADKITGELKPLQARNSGANNLALQINKLIHVSEIARRARECPAGKDCFELLAQARGGGQFKIGLEAVYKNGQRKTVSRAAGDLSRLIPLSVDKPSGVELSSVLVNVIAEAAGEFTRTATANSAALAPLGPIKK